MAKHVVDGQIWAANGVGVSRVSRQVARAPIKASSAPCSKGARSNDKFGDLYFKVWLGVIFAISV